MRMCVTWGLADGVRQWGQQQEGGGSLFRNVFQMPAKSTAWYAPGSHLVSRDMVLCPKVRAVERW